MSYGRGGAGNIAPIQPQEVELQQIGSKTSSQKQKAESRQGDAQSPNENEAYFSSGRG